MRNLIFILSFPILMSCSNKIEHADRQELASLRDATYAECGVFADDTFVGKVFQTAGEHECFDILVLKQSNNLFSNEKVFLQFFPFYAEADAETEYGEPLSFFIMSERNEKPIIQSKVLDRELLVSEVDEDYENFFQDYFLRVCSVKSKWNGLMIATFYDKDRDKLYKPDKPQVMRKTTVLLPPFLSDVEDFKDQYGEELAKDHPLVKLEAAFNQNNLEYTADELCLKK